MFKLMVSFQTGEILGQIDFSPHNKKRLRFHLGRFLFSLFS